MSEILDNIKKIFSKEECIDYNDKANIRILDIDNKELIHLKNELEYLDLELNKHINLDIFLIYKREYKNNIETFNRIKTKYAYLLKHENKLDLNKTSKEKVNKLISRMNEIDELIIELNSTINDVYNRVKNSKFEIENTAIQEVMQIDEINKKIDEINKRFIKITKEKEETKRYSLLWLKNNIIELKKNYSKLKEINVDDIEKYVKVNNDLDEILKKCEIEIKGIKEKTKTEEKEEILNPKRIIKKEKNFVLKKDRSLINSSINEDIKKTKNEIEKLKEIFNKKSDSLKEKTIYNGINSYIKEIIKIEESSFPITLFKNEEVGFLTSNILINNRIRLIRNLIDNKDVSCIEYDNIEGQIDSKIDTLYLTKNIINSIIDQIEKLQDEIKFKYRNSNIDMDKLNENMKKLKKSLNGSYDKIEVSISIERV